VHLVDLYLNFNCTLLTYFAQLLLFLCWLTGQPSRDANNLDWLPTLAIAPVLKTDDRGMFS